MMAEAIARGLIESGIDPSRITAFDPSEERLAFFSEQLGVLKASNNTGVIHSADVVILAVKPYVVSEVLSSIGSEFKSDQLLISIAAGVTTEFIEKRFEAHIPVIRVMPNTPCLIGKGVSAISSGKYAGEAQMEIAAEIFGAVGEVVRVTEDKIDAVTGLSGSGPAYVYTFIEALADGGVRMGLPRATALLLAAQTVSGAAEMVIQSAEHPAVLRDRVTTPGGTTIAGTAVLEAEGFRSAIIKAVTAAAERSAELGKPKNS
jgi:pyrroline-5-carboxylate reductase